MFALHAPELDEVPDGANAARVHPAGLQQGKCSAGAHNALLSALPGDVVHRLSSNLELVHLPAGKLLWEPGDLILEVHFPASSIVATSYLMENGNTAEVALIGREGVVGVPLILGTAIATVRARVQSAGLAFKLAAPILLDEFARSGDLMRVLLHYAGRHIAQIAQTAASNRHGTLEQRLCRWLLQNLDRVSGNELSMTHECIANALGAKREWVTERAGRLRREGAISYRRGRITVLDRSTLERRAGECYDDGSRRHDREDLALL